MDGKILSFTFFLFAFLFFLVAINGFDLPPPCQNITPNKQPLISWKKPSTASPRVRLL